jgi:acetyltransferase-like isoleucine patch superfamily enzyme
MIDVMRAAIRQLKQRFTDRILSLRIQGRHPTLVCHPTAVWNYAFKHIDAIELGEHVSVAAFAEIIVYKHARHSAVEGRLILGDRAVISTGANVRAAGGIISIGKGSGIGQYTVVVAANHGIKPGMDVLNSPYDENRTGVFIGDNVWVGANCTVLAGVTIGDNSVIAAGSLVATDVPAGEIWGGNPARRKMSVAEFARFRR